MRETGIVRRIDELGRVVIPKEIRKTLRIRENDPLEFYTERDQLILKKYSPVSSVSEIAESIAQSIYQILEKPCVITDTDAVLIVTGNKDRDWVNKTLSAEFEKILKDRKSLVASRQDGNNPVTVCRGGEPDVENQIVVPVVSNGDCFGAIVIYDRDKTARFTSTDVKLAQLAALTLAKQFE